MAIQTILTRANTKIQKGMARGYATSGIHFAPVSLSGFNVCKWASEGCAASCLNTSGKGVFAPVQLARIRKTQRFFKDRAAFMSQLFAEIGLAIAVAAGQGLIPAFRLNLTSDVPWERVKGPGGLTVFDAFPGVQFYDYTKSPERMTAFLARELPSNYHLTFSRSEDNGQIANAIIASGGNVAVVFSGKELPASYRGRPVINGDADDLRFLDKPGVVVGLLAKGKARNDTTGFVVHPEL